MLLGRSTLGDGCKDSLQAKDQPKKVAGKADRVYAQCGAVNGLRLVGGTDYTGQFVVLAAYSSVQDFIFRRKR